MNQWQIRKNGHYTGIQKSNISKRCVIHPKSKITGKVFISEGVSLGYSKLTALDDYYIHIGKDTSIKDFVLLLAKDSKFPFHENEIKIVKDIYIGNHVFISSDVSIYGPVLISDKSYIGTKTIIVNSKIGENCTIENNVLIKNISLPPNTYIERNSIIDSVRKLNEIMMENLVTSQFDLSSLSLHLPIFALNKAS